MFRNPITRKISWWASLIFFVTACFVFLGSYVAALVISLPTDGTAHPTNEFEYYDGYSMICMNGKACISPFATEEAFQFRVEFDSLFREMMKESIFDEATRKAAFGELEKSTYLLPLWMPVLALGILFAFFTQRSMAHKQLKSHMTVLGIFRKPIVRKISWWTTMVLLVVLSMSWIGSFMAGLYAFIPTTSNASYGHGLTFSDGYSILCDDGDLCVWGFALGDSFKIGIAVEHYKRDSISDMVDETRRDARWGIVFDLEKPCFLLPFWMPIVAIGMPFAFVTRRALIRQRLTTDGIAYRWMPNRRSKKICIPLAFVVFGLTLLISPDMFGHFLTELYGREYQYKIRHQFGLSDSALLAIALTLWIVSAYIIARIAYGLFRRKRIPISENGSPLCLTCRFNLKGNTSGICPECGTPVQSNHVPRTGS